MDKNLKEVRAILKRTEDPKYTVSSYTKDIRMLRMLIEDLCVNTDPDVKNFLLKSAGNVRSVSQLRGCVLTLLRVIFAE